MAPARTMPTVQAPFHWVILCNTTHLLLTDRAHRKAVYTVILILNSALLNPPRDLTQQDSMDFHGLLISNNFPLFGVLTHWVTTKNWLLQKYFKTLQLQIHSPIYMYRPLFHIHLTKLTHEASCNSENYHYFFIFLWTLCTVLLHRNKLMDSKCFAKSSWTNLMLVTHRTQHSDRGEKKKKKRSYKTRLSSLAVLLYKQ